MYIPWWLWTGFFHIYVQLVRPLFKCCSLGFLFKSQNVGQKVFVTYMLCLLTPFSSAFSIKITEKYNLRFFIETWIILHTISTQAFHMGFWIFMFLTTLGKFWPKTIAWVFDFHIFYFCSQVWPKHFTWVFELYHFLTVLWKL